MSLRGRQCSAGDRRAARLFHRPPRAGVTTSRTSAAHRAPPRALRRRRGRARRRDRARAAAQQPFDAMTLDILMPGMSGLVLRAAGTSSSARAVVVVSVFSARGALGDGSCQAIRPTARRRARLGPVLAGRCACSGWRATACARASGPCEARHRGRRGRRAPRAERLCARALRGRAGRRGASGPPAAWSRSSTCAAGGCRAQSSCSATAGPRRDEHSTPSP
jgi:CheY-like chemotaxis protein